MSQREVELAWQHAVVHDRGVCVPRLIHIVWLLWGCTFLSGTCVAAPLIRAPDSLPLIIAHRGGTADAPENTLEGIRQAIDHHADLIWLSVQLSKEGEPVLYRPADLAALTDASGPVSSLTVAELAQVNAGWTFRQIDGTQEIFPFRNQPVGIPTLSEALRAIPPHMVVILDMKALPAASQTAAVARVLTDEDAWSRVVIYSSEADYQRSFAVYPQADLFESRDATRLRLLRVLLGVGCVDPPIDSTWTGFELHRKLTITEQVTLGEGRSEVEATLWTPESVACFRQRSSNVRIVALGVNSAADYRLAACLGVDAVLADSPRKMAVIRANLTKPLQCSAVGKTVPRSQ